MAIKPLLHRIVVRQAKLEETNKDYQRAKAIGIEIPDHPDKTRAQAGVDVGIVVSIGPTAYRDFNIEPQVKVGDEVAFARFSGKMVVDPATQEEFVVLNDEDLVVIITGELNG